MKLLKIWTETDEARELVTGYLMHMKVQLIYTKVPNLVLADVTNLDSNYLQSLTSVIINAKGENHLVVDENVNL